MRTTWWMLAAVLTTGCTWMEREPARAEAQARQVLANTSIEDLDRQKAFARYGKPHAVIRRADGRTAWVYRDGHYKTRGLRFELVFDDAGNVIDLRYLPYDGAEPISKTQIGSPSAPAPAGAR